jgi:drug/metabolite transporter (DMT)-like permease
VDVGNRVAIVAGVVGLLLTGLPALVGKSLDGGILTLWAVLIVGVVAILVIVVADAKNRPGSIGTILSAARQGRVARRGSHAPDTPYAKSATAGFLYALTAAACWSIGNVAMRITAATHPSASFDIAVLNYVTGAVGLLVLARALAWRRGEAWQWPSIENPLKFGLVALGKGVNTYSWILAVTLITAGSAATLENMHVTWTILVLAIFLGYRFSPGTWLVLGAGSASLTFGAWLISGRLFETLSWSTVAGIGLGALSGISFSAFYVLWERKGQHSSVLWRRSAEMSVLLFGALLVLFPIHVMVNSFWLGGSLSPFGELDRLDVGMQLASGLIGIGATYFLINESLFRMRGHKWGSLLLGIGLSYSVPLTMLLEAVWFGLTMTTGQIAGAVLFAVGFVAVIREVIDRRSRSGQPLALSLAQRG